MCLYEVTQLKDFTDEVAEMEGEREYSTGSSQEGSNFLREQLTGHDENTQPLTGTQLQIRTQIRRQCDGHYTEGTQGRLRC